MPCPNCKSGNTRWLRSEFYVGPVSCYECNWTIWKQHGVTTYEELAEKLKEVKVYPSSTEGLN